MATEFKRNEKTGILEAWRNGRFIGNVITMGDNEKKSKDKRDEHSNKKQ